MNFILAYATSQTQCLQGTESSFSLGDCARVAEHPVDVRLATTEAERRPDTPPLWGELAKGKLSHVPLFCSGVFDLFAKYGLLYNRKGYSTSCIFGLWELISNVPVRSYIFGIFLQIM